MKVVFLTNLPSPYRRMFFSELGKLCDLTVIYEREEARDRDKKWKSEYVNTYEEIFLKSKNIGDENSVSFDILKYLKKNQYDIYIIGMYSTFTAMLAIMYLKIKRIPFIQSTDGGFISDENRLKYIVKRFFIGSADLWLSTGDNSTKYLCHYGAEMEKIVKYPFTSIRSIDLNNRSKMNLNEKELIKQKIKINEEKVLISVGRFSYGHGYRKGFDTILDVADKIDPEIGIYIIGEKPSKEFVKKKQDKNLNNVHFIGFLEQNDLSKYYAVADAFILLTREDIWGLVINEAMSFSLPIITTYQCNAGLELIKDDVNGYLVDAEDVASTVEIINKIFSNNELLNRLGRNAKVAIQDYSIENMANRHIEIFEEFCQRKK